MTALLVSLLAILSIIAGCDGSRGTSRCKTPLSYETDINTTGQNAVTGASVYYAGLLSGSDDYVIKAKLDTGSSLLVVNENDFLVGHYSRVGKRPYVIENAEAKSFGVSAMDNFEIGCGVDILGKFNLSSGTVDTPNILGLAFGDTARLPHEARMDSFFDQLVHKNGFNDVISLALCGTRGNSHVLLGGVDDKMSIALNKFIPIIEKSSYVVPALTLRRADNKKFIGAFPSYDPQNKKGRKTILDSGTAFNMLPIDMAVAMTKEVFNFAKNSKAAQFPEGFFRTERSTSTKVARFASMAHLRQFPAFEINFYGSDGKTKSLELSPLHYFKEMDASDPMIRTYAIRETEGEVILGQPFLENHYVVFDRHQGRIGFGNIDVACMD